MMAGKKKSKSRKGKSTNKTSVHEMERKPKRPKYCEMIQATLGDHKRKIGLSSQEILQYISAKYIIDEKTAKRNLTVTLTNGVKKGHFIKIRGTGAAELYGLRDGTDTQFGQGTRQIPATAKKKIQLKKSADTTATRYLAKPKTPKYSEMIQEALIVLKQQRGSSRQHILKYIISKYSTNEKTVIRNLNVALKTGVKNGIFRKIRGTGADETYRLGDKTHDMKSSKSKGHLSMVRKNKKLTNAGKLSSSKTVSQKRSSNKSIMKSKTKNPATTDRRKKTSSTKTISQKRISNKSILKPKTVKSATTDSRKKTTVVLTKVETTNTKEKQDPWGHGSEDNASVLSDVTLSHQESIYVKIPGDELDCQIGGLDLTPDGRMVVVDSANKSLKIFDQERQFLSSYTFYLPMYGVPTAVAVLTNEEVIVSLLTDTLQTRLKIIGIERNKLAIKHTIPLSGYSITGVACHQDKIFIAGARLHVMETPFVRLIDRDGQTLWSTHVKGRAHLHHYMSCYVSCFSTLNRLAVIVIDTYNQTLTKLDGDTGCIGNEYEVFGKGSIKGSTYGRGILYVSYFGSREVCAFDSSLSSNRILLYNSDWSPVCVKYVELGSQLLISKECTGEGTNYVECFQLSHLS